MTIFIFVVVNISILWGADIVYGCGGNYYVNHNNIIIIIILKI